MHFHFSPFEGDSLNVVIETPKGSRNKFNFDEEKEMFKLGGVLPAGASFPFDFGFVPGTKAEDGDPLDVLLIMDEPAFPGCLVQCRIIGIIEAEQTEHEETVRNDRVLAVSQNSRLHQSIRSIQDLHKELMDEIEHFFISYNNAKGKTFKVLARRGRDAAIAAVRKAITS